MSKLVVIKHDPGRRCHLYRNSCSLHPGEYFEGNPPCIRPMKLAAKQAPPHDPVADTLLMNAIHRRLGVCAEQRCHIFMA